MIQSPDPVSETMSLCGRFGEIGVWAAGVPAVVSVVGDKIAVLRFLIAGSRVCNQSIWVGLSMNQTGIMADHVYDGLVARAPKKYAGMVPVLADHLAGKPLAVGRDGFFLAARVFPDLSRVAVLGPYWKPRSSAMSYSKWLCG